MKDLMPDKSEYRKWLDELKEKVKHSQWQATFRLNRAMLELYWDLGESIILKQMTSGWGNFVVDNLAKDLQKEFPGMEGFSSRNLFYMKKWVQFYNSQKLPQAVAEIKNLVISIPWGHNRLILEKIKNQDEALWYVNHVIENGISRNVLFHQIGWDLYSRQVKEKKITNFATTLPPLQSDLEEKALKDPYIFDFLTLGNEAHEREIERELTKHITNFLLELGKGFAFVGKQVHLSLGDDDFYIDLLFYNLNLRSYIIIELKAGKFTPGDAGQILFYVNIVDAQLKREGDNPTIGLILCKNKSQVLAEYALSGINKPIGISEYRLTSAIPENLKTSLPSIEDIEEELNQYLKEK